METAEDIKAAKEIIHAILRTKKNLRMYPENNPIYARTIGDTYTRFRSFFNYRDELNLKINQNDILYDSEQIYYNPGKDDNLAFFFFKDGLREITFKNGLSETEIEEFLKILSLDFDREFVDDDIVTLLWERDFQNIRYVVDEAFLAEDEDYETEAVREIKEKAPDADELLKAYDDAFKADEVKGVSIVPLTDDHLHSLARELERDVYDKTDKLVEILFEMLYQAESAGDYEDALNFLEGAIEFSIRHGNMETASSIMKRATGLINDPSLPDNVKRQMRLLFSFPSSGEMIKLLGELLDSVEIDEKVFDEYVRFLDKNAIPPFITILGELKSINARKNVINALTFLGGKDIRALASGLQDSRWYVVRNIIYILRKIGDKKAEEYLLKAVRHSDVRVRKEVIKTLGELGNRGVLQTLKDCLEDPESQVRISAARALSNIAPEVAKRIILEKVSGKNFMDRDLDEKKEFYEILSQWKDGDVVDFLMRTLKKKSFFRGAVNDENRACAAYCLGLMGNKDALPVLYELRDSKNELLREYAYTAIKRIEYGR